MQVCKYTSMKACEYSNINYFNFASMQVCKNSEYWSESIYSSMQDCKQVYMYSSMQAYKHIRMQGYKYTYMQVCKYRYKLQNNFSFTANISHSSNFSSVKH